MKKIIIALTLVASTLGMNAQKFKGNVSGIYGLWNEKIRIQYEAPAIADGVSVGLNMNYYFGDWKGPMFEPLIRAYTKTENASKGFFYQGKLIVGSLSTLQDSLQELTGTIENKRTFVYGFSAGKGYKFLMGDHFTFEAYAGLRIISKPSNRYANTSEDFKETNIIFWKVGTGSPVEINFRLGYQF